MSQKNRSRAAVEVKLVRAVTQPYDQGRVQLATVDFNQWSSYWYNNFVYESDITRGPQRLEGG